MPALTTCDIGRVQAEGVEISPLVASANPEAEAVDPRITDAALCAITLRPATGGQGRKPPLRVNSI